MSLIGCGINNLVLGVEGIDSIVRIDPGSEFSFFGDETELRVDD